MKQEALSKQKTTSFDGQTEVAYHPGQAKNGSVLKVMASSFDMFKD